MRVEGGREFLFIFPLSEDTVFRQVVTVLGYCVFRPS